MDDVRDFYRSVFKYGEDPDFFAPLTQARISALKLFERIKEQSKRKKVADQQKEESNKGRIFRSFARIHLNEREEMYAGLKDKINEKDLKLLVGIQVFLDQMHMLARVFHHISEKAPFGYCMHLMHQEATKRMFFCTGMEFKFCHKFAYLTAMYYAIVDDWKSIRKLLKPFAHDNEVKAILFIMTEVIPVSVDYMRVVATGDVKEIQFIEKRMINILDCIGSTNYYRLKLMEGWTFDCLEKTDPEAHALLIKNTSRYMSMLIEALHREDMRMTKKNVLKDEKKTQSNLYFLPFVITGRIVDATIAGKRLPQAYDAQEWKRDEVMINHAKKALKKFIDELIEQKKLQKESSDPALQPKFHGQTYLVFRLEKQDDGTIIKKKEEEKVQSSEFIKENGKKKKTTDFWNRSIQKIRAHLVPRYRKSILRQTNNRFKQKFDDFVDTAVYNKDLEDEVIKFLCELSAIEIGSSKAEVSLDGVSFYQTIWVGGGGKEGNNYSHPEYKADREKVINMLQWYADELEQTGDTFDPEYVRKTLALKRMTGKQVLTLYYNRNQSSNDGMKKKKKKRKRGRKKKKKKTPGAEEEEEEEVDDIFLIRDDEEEEEEEEEEEPLEL